MPKQEPSEFALFVRDAGVRAVDRLSETAQRAAAPVRAVLRAWNKLTPEQKFALFDALIAMAQPGEEEEAAPKKAAKKRASTKKKKTTSRKSSKK